MPYDLSACGLVTVCQLKVGGTGNTVVVGNDGGGVFMETDGTIGSRNIRIQNGNSSFSEYSSLNVRGQDQNVSFNTNSVERMRIANGGNIGIGTSSPAFKLHVCSTTTQDGLLVENTLRNVTCFKSTGEHAFMYIDSAHQCIYQPAIFFMRAGATFSELRLQRASSSDSLGNYTESEGLIGSTGNTPFSIQSCGTRRIHLATNGNVGINTISPGSLLSVNNCTATGYCAQNTLVHGQWFRVSNPNATANVASSIMFEASGAPGGNGLATISGVATGVGSMSMTFGTRDGGGNVTERMRLTSAGCVGINIASPSYALHVNGTFYAAGSSVDYKQGICQYDTDSCMFMKLKPVTYQYKEEYKHLGKELKSETQIGLIAEEVAETYPELAILVKENDNDVVRNVDYEKLSIVLLSEVQKLRKEVDDLKTNK